VAEFIVGADERVESDIADNGGGGVAGAGGAAVATNIGGGGWSRDSLAYSSAYVAVRYLDYTIKSKGGKGVGDMLQYLQNNKGKNLDDAFANASHQAFASNAAFLADIAKGGSQTFMRNVMNDAMLANDDTGSVGGSDVTGKPANELTAESVLNDFGSRSGTQTMTGFKEKWDDDLSSADGSANILSFLVGPNAGQTISTNIGAMNLGALGLGDLDVTDPDSASLAVRHIDQALSYVDNNRARMGAQMSRFQQTIGYLQTSSLNHQAALSRMRDADLAAEMSALGRAQILQSAAQAMVAQANQASRLLLQLLQHP
jgi:flagellin